MEKIEKELYNLLQEPVANLNYNIVRIKLFGDQTLQIMIENISDEQILVEDCVKVSHLISAILDVEDVIKSAYTLEVSSPGIDRPLIWLKDYGRFAGRDAKITTNTPVAGSKNFSGKISSITEDSVIILLKNEQIVEVPYDAIASGKLLFKE